MFRASAIRLAVKQGTAARKVIAKATPKIETVEVSIPPTQMYKIDATTDAEHMMSAIWQDWYSHRAVDKEIGEAVKSILMYRGRGALGAAPRI
ncbi:hypothetical protein BCR35DRAFT_351583 [Leucosporidium creatinivorum]|uniref:Uncharacterized protein n=1 Tax=Leucosporidium creatinivorum TaxID=106004 RepID=A0A1Y2FPW3_9BASI|nr:hypothetical protein BCR35DRAFT_351583 [Leucosporidium creatinivorum]